MNGPRVAQSGESGEYRFDSLAPGRYLLLSSLDITEVTEDAMAAGQARAITIERGQTTTQDLDLNPLP